MNPVHPATPLFHVIRAAPAVPEPPSPAMERSVAAVERIVGYAFRNKRLLEEALTHSSFSETSNGSDAPAAPAFSYQRLEYLGDAAIGLAVSNYAFLAYPGVDPGQLSLLRAANISTEKLARVAVRHGLYHFLRRNAPALDDKVREFADAVSSEDDAVAHGGSIKAPKVLADIVESIAAAIYVDVDFDLQRLWVIFRGLLEPMVTLEDLLQQPQPITVLFELCQKHGKQLDIEHWKDESKNVVSIHVDGKFVASGSSEQKDIARLNAAKLALHKLWKTMPPTDGLAKILSSIDDSFEIEGAKQKLHELCGKKKWLKPTYNIEKEEGRAHEKVFTSSVKIPTVNGVLCMTGDEKSRVRDAENSAASLMIRALQEYNYL